MLKKVAFLAVAALPVFASSAYATDVTDTLGLSATVISSCTNVVGADINFGGSIVSISSPINASTTMAVNCTSGVPYVIGIDNGAQGGRVMSDGAGHTLDYELYTDNSYSVGAIWPNISVSSFGGTGTGSDQTFTIYGRLPSQITPVSATYNDTVTVTVRY